MTLRCNTTIITQNSNNKIKYNNNAINQYSNNAINGGELRFRFAVSNYMGDFDAGV